jgi:hypothetical protein
MPQSCPAAPGWWQPELVPHALSRVFFVQPMPALPLPSNVFVAALTGTTASRGLLDMQHMTRQTTTFMSSARALPSFVGVLCEVHAPYK